MGFKMSSTEITEHKFEMLKMITKFFPMASKKSIGLKKKTKNANYQKSVSFGKLFRN